MLRITRFERALAGAAILLSLASGLRGAADLRISGPTHFGQLGEGKMNYTAAFPVLRQDVADVSVGFAHVLYIDTQGRLWGYGANESNQLGGGSREVRVTPILIASDVASAHAGTGWSLFVREDGRLYGMGRGAGGLWGGATTPARVTAPRLVAQGVRKATTKVAHAAFLFEDGTLSATGYQPYLGGPLPIFHDSLLSIATNVADVALGSSGVFYLKNDGNLYGVGLAIPGSTSLHTPPAAPLHIASNVAHFAAGGELVFYVTNSGQLYGMGASESGALGLGEDMLAASTPQLIAGNVKRVYTDGEMTFFIDTSDSLWGFGDNLYGQLGDGTFQDRYEPVPLITSVADVSTRRTATLAVRLDGSLVGAGNFELLGLPPNASISVPRKADEGVVSVEVGDQSVYYIDDAGALFGVGRNDAGQLGIGTYNHVSAAAQIATGVAQVSASATHVLYLTDSGDVMGSGSNEFEQLGAGAGRVNLPKLVASSATSIAAGDGFSLFTTADSRSLWFVGAADNESILGDEEPASMPHLLATGVIDASAADNVFYVTTSGELRARGAAFIQASGGTVEADGSLIVDTDVVDVDTAAGYAIYRKSDQTLWGVGSFSALSSARLGFYAEPQLIDEGVAKARAGSLAFLYQKADGSLWLRAMSLSDARRLGYQYGEFEYGESVRIWSGAVVEDFSINSYNVGLLSSSAAAPTLAGATISKTSVAAGEPTALNLDASGLFLNVSWYQGEVGDETTPLPAIDNLLGATVYPQGNGKYWAKISNELGTVSTSAPLAVTITNPTYAAWGLGQGLGGADLWHEADPDADGIINALEYAFGVDPVVPSPPMPRIDAEGDGYILRHAFNLEALSPEPKVDLVYEYSDDLEEWAPYPTDGRLTLNLETRQASLAIPRSEADGGAVFVRVRSEFMEAE